MSEASVTGVSQWELEVPDRKRQAPRVPQGTSSPPLGSERQDRASRVGRATQSHPEPTAPAPGGRGGEQWCAREGVRARNMLAVQPGEDLEG